MDGSAIESAFRNRDGKADPMLDILFLGGALTFFGLSALAVRACDRV